MATRKKIVLRRQRRSAVNRRKRQTGKRIYRRKVMRGGVSYKTVGLVLTAVPDIKNAIKSQGKINFDNEDQITTDSIKNDIVPIIKTKIVEKIPQEKKAAVETLLDSLFNIITNPPSDIATAKKDIDKLFADLKPYIPFTAMPFYYLIQPLLPKLLDIVAAASTTAAPPPVTGTPGTPGTPDIT